MGDSVTGEARMLIDGELVEAASGARYDNVNPATEEVIGTVADAGADDMRRAIGAARRAFDETDWSQDRELRKRCLRQLHEALAKERENLRPQIVAEVGTPIMLTYAVQMDSCIDDMEWDIECIDRVEWEYDLPVHEFFGMSSARRVLREPIGVVGAITPWNFPFMLNLSKIIPALAAGNTVILKPAPDTPWSATHIGRLVAELTDLPAGVLNIVTSGDPAGVGEVVSDSPDVDMISFTGSTATGKRIMAHGSETLKRVFLELGGKSANIILDDADFPAQMGSGAMVCMHGGQGCAITTRMLVPRSRYDEAVDLLRAGFEAWSYGDPTDPANMQGPLINARQRERVLGYIEKGKQEGARLVVGGGRPPQFEKGYYVEPTLFVDVDPDSTIAQEEIFGPVLVVIPYEDDDDAVRIANNSRYGLSGAVNGGDLDRAYAIAKRLRTGTVAVNGGQWFGPDSPFGGYKESGLGREHGMPGFEEYLETKTVGLPTEETDVAALIYVINASLDGYIEDVDGKFDFTFPSEELHAFVNDVARHSPTYLYGRRMYETMKVWETDQDLIAQADVTGEFAEIWQAADKIVYSRTLAAPSTARTTIERDFDVDAVRAAKASAKEDLMIGGATIAAEAFRAGLVDECHLLLHPVAVGGGKPALPAGVRLHLRLLDERPFADGVVHLHYAVQNDG